MRADVPNASKPVILGFGGSPSGAHGVATSATPGAQGADTLDYHPHGPRLPDRFEVLKRAGVGAFGSVWKAHDKELGRTVAVKVPRRDQLDERETQRFLQEARNAAQLKHPNIVSVYEVGCYEEGVYIVAEYVEGQSLDELLKQQPPTAHQAAELCGVIAEAVHYAHEAGVIHRDLKPANIIVDADGVPHITDFGLARRTSDDATLTADGRLLGTPAYMSPEQVQADSRQIDHRTDVYALGVLLFELLTGERPFRGSVQMLIHQVMETEAPRVRELNSGIPRDLENICAKCLEKDPRRRYQNARLLAEDLQRFVGGEPVTARPLAPPIRVWRWCRRNRLAAGLMAAVFLVLIGGLAGATTQWRRAEKAAAQEAATRSEIELLTQQLVELAERLRRLEQGGLKARSSPFRAAEHSAGLHVESALGRPKDTPKGAQAQDDQLRAEAKATLRRLEHLSPVMADNCRKVLAELDDE